MMSGRGLGHTGGTLDKLEAIPGFSVELDDAAYRSQLGRIHQAMIGQSADIVPADRQLYALRDVTATVESVPLICASILSKKLAEGIDALVLDVKCGSGAFMQTEAEARELAEALVRISTSVGKPTTALITRMDQPLGCTVGNALEVIEAIECLKGNGPDDLMTVTYELTAEMMRLGGLCEDREAALSQLNAAIGDGRALLAFKDLIEAQGGDAMVIDAYERLPQASQTYDLCYESDEALAYVEQIDALRVGEAARLLGAGRAHVDAVVDLAVGLKFYKKIGDAVQPGEIICRIYYNDAQKLELALARLNTAFSFSKSSITPPHILIDRINGT
jgi:pyrimidine-nucleoside phosphorylase